MIIPTSTGIDPQRCPVCGHPNECAMVAGKGVCWCFNERISPEVMERIPQEARGIACLCSECATGRREPTSTLRRMRGLIRQRG
jgi:hypothetical protein